MKKLLIVAAVVVVVLVVGGTLVIRALLDPENIRRELERQASAALDQPVRIGSAELSIWPRAGVTLHDLVVGEPAAVTLTRTEVSTAMRALLDRRIEDAEVVIEDSELDLPLVLATLDRLAASNASTGESGGAAGGSEAPAVTIVNVRTLALHDVRIKAGPRSAVFDMESSLDGDRLDVHSATVASEVTSLEATGTVESLAGRKARLEVKAESLDLDGLIVFAREFARQAVPPGAPAEAGDASPAGPLDITLVLEAARGQAAGVAFEQLASTAHVTSAGIRFDPLSLGIFGGQLEGTIDVDLSGEEPALAVNGALSSVDMTRLTEFAGQSGSVTGTLNGTLALTGSGIDPERAMASARGQGSASITDGTMSGLQLVRPIVLAFGKPDAAQPAEGGERFSRLGATYRLANGVVTLSDLSFDSRDVELDGAGTLALDGGRLDIHANARLSKELTAQAGRDLVRYAAENGQVVLPATVSGTVVEPRVGIDIGNVAERALKNELKRQTESAIRSLFDRKKPK